MSGARPAHIPADRVADLDVYVQPRMTEDYQQAWRDAQAANSELVWTPRNEGHWIAMHGEVLAEVQSDHARFSSRIIIFRKSIGETHGLIPTTIDPTEQRPYRLRPNATMAPAAVRRMLPDIRATAADLIDGFLADGGCDFTHDYAHIFPIRIFMAMGRLPMADAPSIQLWAESMTQPAPVMPFDVAKAAFYAYLAPILAGRRSGSGGDLISHIVNADIDGRDLTEDEALSLCTQILIAGVDTVVNFFGFVMLFLASNPEARHELAAGPAMIPQATHEPFRRFGLFTTGRAVRDDMNYRGVSLKAGELVALPTLVHGLDDTINECPVQVDFARLRSRHSAFGKGPHLCPGQELARTEVAVTIKQWHARILDFAVAEDGDTGGGGGIACSVNRLCLEWAA